MGIRAIAQQTKVSIATVSRVLNNPQLVKKSTRDKVLQALQAANYQKYHANYLTSILDDEIGLVIPNVRNSFFARIVEGINTKAMALNLTINLYLTDNDSEVELQAIEKLSQKNIKGVILVSARNQETKTYQNLEILKRHNIPLVLVDRDISDDDYSGVFLANANAVYDAVSLLIKNGTEKITIVIGPKNNINSNERLKGYLRALKDNKLPINHKFIHYSDFSFQGGMNAARKILRANKLPEYIFAGNNQIALGCIVAINQQNLILNKDINVFSFNKLDASPIDTINIQYIDHPVETMGEKSVTILKNKIIGTKGLIREVLS